MNGKTPLVDFFRRNSNTIPQAPFANRTGAWAAVSRLVSPDTVEVSLRLRKQGLVRWQRQRKIDVSASTLALFLLLIPGLLLFVGLHLLREFGMQERLQSRLGTGPYRLLFSVAILISLVLIVQGKAGAPFIQLWVPPFNLRSLTHLIMISATMLFIAGSLPHSFTRELVIHPMLLGVTLWGIAHLISNGDLASVLLFGSLPLWAVVKIVSLERIRHRARVASGQSALPPALRPALQWDAAAIVLGVIAYAVFLVFHGQMFGLALIAPV